MMKTDQLRQNSLESCRHTPSPAESSRMKTPRCNARRGNSHLDNARRGVVLLIVLGMLSLFTVLIVSFVVFSSQGVQSSYASQERRLRELLPAPPIDAAVLQMIIGTDDPMSAAYGNSLFEDIYGVDGKMMRVGHRRGAPPAGVGMVPASSRGQLLLPLQINNQPQTTLFKFPTNMVYWYFDGPAAPPGPAMYPYADIMPHLDDALAGRIVTFDEGPLKNKSFRVIRSLGIDNGTPNQGGSITDAVEYSLAGNLVIDLSELDSETITVNGIPEPLYPTAANTPNQFLYGPGPDGFPGGPGDDDGQNGANDPGELGWPGSDDLGFRFVLNGTVFNGRGVNTSGDSGLVRNNRPGQPASFASSAWLDRYGDIEFTLNSRLTGTAYWGGVYPGNAAQFQVSPPEFDEAWDAADLENLFLAWQPSDHRRPILTPANQVYGGIDATRLNRQLGQHVIPSFHRPSIINYLMNAPIRIAGDNVDPTSSNPTNPYIERTFFDIKNNFQPNSPNFDAVRLQALATRIRRATLRPLNFPHQYVDAASSDLNQDGDPFDGAPLFSGSNSVAILNQTIDVSASPAQVISQIERLARWLINGPWDVDNDDDGLPDSIWVDFNLPTVDGPNGQRLKPMIAPLIEDMGGKINVNHTGSYNQLIQPRFNRPEDYVPALTGNPGQYDNGNEYAAINLALGTFGHGGGVGPAEIDFSHLFQFERSPAASFLGPLPTNQVEQARHLDQVLSTRYGNLLNVRYGGAVYNYASSYPYVQSSIRNTIPPRPADVLRDFPENIYPYFGGTLPPNFRLTRFLHYPGVGTRLQPFENADLLARIPFPSRSHDHQANVFAGRPLDYSGTEQTTKDQYGSHRFNRPYRSADTVNHPYEFGATEVRGDDTPFSPAEYVDFLAGGPLSGRLSQLLSDAAQRNEALGRVLTTESRSVDSPEVPGEVSLLHLIASRFQDHATRVTAPDASIPPAPAGPPNRRTQSTHLSRMLAVELRKGSKLNLNRQLGNIQDDNSNGFGDEYEEIRSGLLQRSASPVAFENNTANNRRSPEPAFPQISPSFGTPPPPPPPPQATAAAHYGPTAMYADPSLGIPDFNGIDLNQDGDFSDLPSEGADIDGDGSAEPIAMGSELLARHLYCLMFALITEDISSNGELVPNYPYPGQLSGATVDIKNRFVARQIAQWATNAVDYRDIDVKFTRLRYDPNPFDGDGFDLRKAVQNEVWGMERPELEITESFAMHDKRLRRNLTKEMDPMDPTVTLDGEGSNDEDPNNLSATPSDSDMDQFRMPQASAFIEIKALAPPVTGNNGEAQPSLSGELYFNNQLDLGRTVGTGNAESPVWRMAVGQRHNGDHNKSSRWVFDADRLVELSRAAGANPDVSDYLNSTMDWTMPATVDAELNIWTQVQRHGADIRHSRLASDPPRTEFVTLADNDFNPANDAGGAPNLSRIRLERFVWFAPLVPTNTLNVVNNSRSGMRMDNVFFNKPDPTDTAAPDLTTNPANAPPLLSPGQYAVVAPRALTHFGQKTISAVGNNFEYSPSDQGIELLAQGTSPQQFRLNYFRNGNTTTPDTPEYLQDNGIGYEVNGVVPIICQSLYPDETGVPAVATRWDEYRTSVAVAQRVDMGFNISAPLPNINYYLAPEQRINTVGTPYPQVDGYRDYVNAAGFHPDTPLDHLTPVVGTAPPLAQNNHEWAAVGTHQEAATIFLQRLADPTIPWHATHNPYITVDFMPMDLSTFNGEHDVREIINRKIVTAGNVPPGAQVPSPVDDKTLWDSAARTFTPQVKFDSRRKIPNVKNDRGLSALLAVNPRPLPPPPKPPPTIRRFAVTHRSPLSMTTSRLRLTTPSGAPQAGPEYWSYNLGSMWHNLTPTAENTDPNQPPGLLDLRYKDPTVAVNALAMDNDGRPFTQSLGFVNREYGKPVTFESYRKGTFGVGSPDLVFMLTVPWMNREYRSPLDLINIPSVSRTRLNATFSPRSMLQDNARREVPTDVFESLEAARTAGPPDIQDSHLLGFNTGMASYRGQDFNGVHAGGRLRLGVVENDITDYNDWTGGRAGFEQLFDYVDVGPVWFDSQRWFDPAKIQFRADRTFDGGNAFQIRLHRMFNRTVETLQPPNNFIGRHRTPGKINLNTTADYIRKGPGFLGNNGEFLDSREDPNDPGTLPANYNPISANPNNSSVRGDGFTSDFVGSRLYGNGSVYRSLAWGHSTQYELDFDYGSPATMGQNNRYFESIDSSFGRGFKGFIESRRGYDTTAGGSNYMGNPELDYRYPTRFAGVFAPAWATRTPSLQRFMRTMDQSRSPQPSSGASNLPMGIPRRTHDMGLLRLHPDFDFRTLSAADRNTVQTAVLAPGNPDFSLRVEADSTTDPVNDPGNNVNMPAWDPNPVNEIDRLRMPMVNSGLLERPQAELHMNRRGLDRDSYFRYANAARMSNLTTSHSNVFLIRLTMGYFEVDPTTGAVGAEFINETGEPKRSRAVYVIDRTIPVGFLRGKNMDAQRTFLYSEISE